MHVSCVVSGPCMPILYYSQPCKWGIGCDVVGDMMGWAQQVTVCLESNLKVTRNGSVYFTHKIGTVLLCGA